MQKKIAKIIETLETADQMFNQLPDISKESMALWKEGIERFAGAIWLHQRGKDSDVEPQA
ncbi:MAG: hypothetical protein WAW37_01395 [Syntrophobacteraceae bacterium]